MTLDELSSGDDVKGTGVAAEQPTVLRVESAALVHDGARVHAASIS